MQERIDPASPRLIVERQEGTTCVMLFGDWDLCEAPRLREVLDGVNASEHVVFDLAAVTYVDSSTLRVFVEFKARSKNLGGSTAVHYGGNDGARRLMTVSGVGMLLR
jgi:anti-anti-sigma factor